ncbi:MAG: hypothetical protein ACFFD4_15805 [Candidatus Odinarchaeota archaeon]
MTLITTVSGISEIIPGLVFFIIALFVLKKDSADDLNRLIALAFSFFSLLLISEGFMYVLQSTDVLIINFLRDATEVSGILAGVFILLAGVEVNRGSFWKSPRMLVTALAITLIAMIGVLFHDVYYNVIGDSIFYYYEGRFFWAFFLASGVPIVELLLSLFLFNNARRQLRDTDPDIARKMLYLHLCMGLIIISATFLIAVLTVLVPAGTSPNILLVILGQVGYLISCVLGYLAFK